MAQQFAFSHFKRAYAAAAKAGVPNVGCNRSGNTGNG